MFKGKMEYKKFKNRHALTYKEAVLAQCYACNGFEEGGVDCLGKSCPLYQFMPYRTGLKKTKRTATPQQLRALRMAREKKKANKPS